MYTLLYLKWIIRTYCRAQGTLLNVVRHPGWDGSVGENGYTCVTEPLCCPLETITTLLTGCIPVQNKKVKKRIYVFCFWWATNNAKHVKWKWSRVRLFVTLWTVGHQALPSMGFPRQEYWSGLPFPSPGDIPDPGIKPRSPALQADALTSEPPGKPIACSRLPINICWINKWMNKWLNQMQLRRWRNISLKEISG